MDFQIKKNRITLWEGSNYIATIAAHERDKKFSITINGMGSGIGFRDSEDLKLYFKRSCCIKVYIPEEVYDTIDAWKVMFLLTSPF